MAWRDDLILPDQPVRLTAGQVEELARKLAALRGEILDYVALLNTLVQPGVSDGTAADAAAPTPRAASDRVLSPRQIEALYDCLAAVRHDINGQGAVVVAVIELLRLKPEEKPRLLAKLVGVPAIIASKLAQLCDACDAVLSLPPVPVPRRMVNAPHDKALADSLAEQPARIRERIRLFSDSFEQTLQIRRRSRPSQSAAPAC